MAGDLAFLTLAQAAAGVRIRQFSASELVEACLGRIAAHNPPLNCFLEVAADSARAAAAAADRAFYRGDAVGSLHGVPLAHKDLFDRALRPATAAAKIRRAAIAPRTATALARLDAAGAIDMGPLHLAEFAAGATGHNVHLGTCLNPWDPARTPGGSSTGSAVAVAARLAFGSLGSDTGGSIRLPAHFCGVAGLRPTYGRVSRAGVMARSWSMDAVGPLARTVEDAALLLHAIAGADDADPTAADIAVPDYRATLEQPLAGTRIGVPIDFFYSRLAPAIRTAIEASLAVYRDLGAVVVPVDVPEIERAFALAQVIAKVEAAALHEPWIKHRADDYAPGIRSEMEAGLLIPAVRYVDALRKRGSLLDAFLRLFERIDLLHTPVYDDLTPAMADLDPQSAAVAQHVMATFGRLTRPFSYLGVPALAVPCGFADGMPVGFQLVGRPFDEARLLNAGHLYQQATEWHRRVPPL
jgi:aspartyl-tRNA(Asn)/glutamyl-tRNA(Gln) amidotransferase subunit A